MEKRGIRRTLKPQESVEINLQLTLFLDFFNVKLTHHLHCKYNVIKYKYKISIIKVSSHVNTSSFENELLFQIHLLLVTGSDMFSAISDRTFIAGTNLIPIPGIRSASYVVMIIIGLF